MLIPVSTLTLVHAGKYWGKDKKVITSHNFFGAIDGDEKLNWVVHGGADAFMIIPPFSAGSEPPPGRASCVAL